MSVSMKMLSGFVFLSLVATVVVPVTADEGEAKKTPIQTENNVFSIKIGGEDGSSLSVQGLSSLSESLRIRIQKRMDEMRSRQKDSDKLLGDPIFSSKAIITIVGPDGKSNTREVTPAKVADGKIVLEMLQGALGDENKLADEILEQVERAFDVHTEKVVVTNEPDELTIVLEKMDDILARLKQLEADVKKLKAAK